MPRLFRDPRRCADRTMQELPAKQIRPRTVRDIRTGQSIRAAENGGSKPAQGAEDGLVHTDVVSLKQKRKVPFTFVPFPRRFLDYLPTLKGNEVKVLMGIAAFTLRYNIYAAKIPMTELTRVTGMHRSAISAAVRGLEDQGILKVSRATKHVSRYEICFAAHVAETRHQEEFEVVETRHQEAV